ncbi:hypothetical protein AAMO2058_000042300 [Amorphochlora amoebiformis]
MSSLRRSNQCRITDKEATLPKPKVASKSARRFVEGLRESSSSSFLSNIMLASMGAGIVLVIYYGLKTGYVPSGPKVKEPTTKLIKALTPPLSSKPPVLGLDYCKPSKNFLTNHLAGFSGSIEKFSFGAFPKAGFHDGDPIPHEVLSPSIDCKTGKFKLSSKYKRVKIDIGLSWNGPNSDTWLTKFPDLMVIGVEPSVYNIMSLFRLYYHKNNWTAPAESRRNYIIPTAVDDGKERMETFYQGAGDGGTSSLNEFKNGNFSTRFITNVPTIRLKKIIDSIPEDQFPLIEHIKSDTQGNDVKVLRSAGDTLQKRVVYYSAEPGEFEKNQYKTSHNGTQLLV